MSSAARLLDPADYLIIAAAVGTAALTIAGRNHFDVLLDLVDDRTELAQVLLGLF